MSRKSVERLQNQTFFLHLQRLQAGNSITLGSSAAEDKCVDWDTAGVLPHWMDDGTLRSGGREATVGVSRLPWLTDLPLLVQPSSDFHVLNNMQVP